MERVSIVIDKSVPEDKVDFYRRRALSRAEKYLSYYDDVLIDKVDEYTIVGPEVEELDVYMIMHDKDIYISFTYHGYVRCVINENTKDTMMNVPTSGEFSVILPVV